MKLFVTQNTLPTPTRRRAGFTLVQMMIAIGILGLLSAIGIGQFGRGRASVSRVECDVHLKEIAMALDTFRQETGRMPVSLADFNAKGYVSAETLRCDADPKLATLGSNPSYSSYSDFYVIREPRDSGELPTIVCPFHEKDGAHGGQAFKGGYTAQFSTKPATLAVGDFSGVVTIERPGQGVLPLPTSGALSLRGGDHIKTGAGAATIHFVDGSTATITENSEMSVMQSYVNGRHGGPLFTLVRQFSGRVNYYVNPGSKFDVATPTATAGALGTRFTVNLAASPNVPVGQLESILTVQEHTVAFTTVERTIYVSAIEGQPPVTIAAHDPAFAASPRRPRNGSTNGWDRQGRRSN